jgi:hypothetical protein
MNIPEDLEKFKDYPEGSTHKRLYDSYHLPFQEYLNKYFTDENFFAWSHWTKWFEWIGAAFDEEKREFFKQRAGYYRIDMNFRAMENFYKYLEIDYLPQDIKMVISFLKYDGFFANYKLEIEDWMNLKNFRNPKQQIDSNQKSINELLSIQYGDNYIRYTFIDLPWWDITRGDPLGK